MQSIKYPSNKISLGVRVSAWLAVTLALGFVHEAYYYISIAAIALMSVSYVAGVNGGYAICYGLTCLFGGTLLAGILTKIR